MRVFISYRRRTWAFAHRLADSLRQKIVGDVFIDVDSIDESDFEQSILRHIQQCDVFLLIVSPETFDPDRIYRERDWVRREVAEALRLELPIVLALVEGIRLPALEDLPSDIREVRSKHGIEFYPRYFDAGIEELAEFIERLGSKRRPRKRVLVMAAAVAILLVAGGLALLTFGQPEAPAEVATQQPEIVPEESSETGTEGEEGWRDVSGGIVLLGSGPDSIDNCTEVVESFAIQETEVTNEAYKLCVDAGRCAAPQSIWRYEGEWTYPAGQAKHPVYNVPWEDASAYCEFIGARLPTEAEWTFAAREGTDRNYPWGDNFDANIVNTVESDYGDTQEVRSLEDGRSQNTELYHMTGNVREWVADSHIDACNLVQGDSGHVAKGGSYSDSGEAATLWTRLQSEVGETLPYAGIRCARD